MGRPCPVPEQSQELVTAEAGDEFGIAGDPLQPSRHRRQYQVTEVVAHGVVDGFEAVEVDQDHRHRPGDPLCVSDRGRELLAEPDPVGQPGQEILPSGPVPPQPGALVGLGRRRYGRTDEAPDAPGRTLSGHEQASLGRDPPALAVHQFEAPVEPVAGAGHQGVEQGGGLSGRVEEDLVPEPRRQQGLVDRPPHHLMAAPTEHLLGPGIPLDDDAGAVDLEERLGPEGHEPRTAVPPVCVGDHRAPPMAAGRQAPLGLHRSVPVEGSPLPPDGSPTLVSR